MTGASKNTIVKLLAEIGSVFTEYQDKTLRNIKVEKIQRDEIWSNCYAKQKTCRETKKTNSVMAMSGFGQLSTKTLNW